MTLSVDWYFDFVSPYSYICLHRLGGLNVSYKPVLFAGLLNHFGQKGPAEIPAKRRWTYRWCDWWARELGIPFRFPAAHPFNPLQHLRLSIALGNRPDAVKKIFASIWTTGADPAAGFPALCREFNVTDESLQASKEALRRNTEEAAARGVFGVPAFVADGEVFWGADSIGFLKDFLRDPATLRNEETRRLDAMPVAAARKA